MTFPPALLATCPISVASILKINCGYQSTQVLSAAELLKISSRIIPLPARDFSWDGSQDSALSLSRSGRMPAQKIQALSC